MIVVNTNQKHNKFSKNRDKKNGAMIIVIEIEYIHKINSHAPSDNEEIQFDLFNV